MATGTLKAVLSKDKFYSAAAKAYSDTYLWKNGDFCTYGDKIYKFIGEDLIAGENWNPNHWAETKLADELESLAAQIEALDPEANVGIFTDVNFTIAANSWTAGTGVWTYNYSNALIKETAGVVAYYDDSFRTALVGDIKLDKYTGYVTFTTNQAPVGTLSGTLRIIDSVAGVLPVSRGGTGATTNKGARQNLNTSIRPIPCSFGTVSSLPQTVYDPDITADMTPSKWLYSNPAACPDGLVCTTATGSVTISLPTGGTFSGETTVYLELVNLRLHADDASGQQASSYASDFVQVGAQTLTDTQKIQARTNIDAASKAEIKPFTVALDDVSNVSGNYSHTTSNLELVTEDMKAIAIDVGTPETFLAPVSITTGNGEITLSCSSVVGTSTVNVTLIRTQPVSSAEDEPEAITSVEFDILANRIGTLSNLTTTAKSSAVAAINELDSDLGSPSSASGVTGADAFSKIDTLNSNTIPWFNPTSAPTQRITTSGTYTATKNAWYRIILNKHDSTLYLNNIAIIFLNDDIRLDTMIPIAKDTIITTAIGTATGAFGNVFEFT